MSSSRAKRLYEFYMRGIVHTSQIIEDSSLAPYQITNQQGRLLGVIHFGCESKKEMSRKYFEEILGIKGPSVTSLLKGLEKNGFITRTIDVEDGRMKQVQTTQKGRELICDMESVFEHTESQLLSGMNKKEREVFLNLLERANENMLRLRLVGKLQKNRIEVNR